VVLLLMAVVVTTADGTKADALHPTTDSVQKTRTRIIVMEGSVRFGSVVLGTNGKDSKERRSGSSS
jgi:hypothetical protein